MRIEPVVYVYRSEERRQRAQERRGREERRGANARSDRRARHAAHPWLSAPFGAHLLGQGGRAFFTASAVDRAYSQPEAKTPLRPRQVASA